MDGQADGFDQLGELYSGSTPSSSRTEFWDGATVWVTPTDLSRLNTPYLHDSAKHITERGLRNCSARLLPPGSIVLSSRAPIGYVAIPTVPFCTNQGCKSIALQNSYHSEFVYYAVTAAVPRLKQLGEGTTFAEISKSSLANAEVGFPIDKAEQAKIAEVLSTVDRAIEQTEVLIAKQQRIKTGLMQDLLTRGIDEDGNFRSEKTHEFKDSALGRIPVEWDVRSMSELTSQIVDGVHHTPTYTSSGVPFIVVSDLTSGIGIDFSHTRFVSETAHAEYTKEWTRSPATYSYPKTARSELPELFLMVLLDLASSYQSPSFVQSINCASRTCCGRSLRAESFTGNWVRYPQGPGWRTFILSISGSFNCGVLASMNRDESSQ